MSNGTPLSPSAAAGERGFFDLLRRELESRGQTSAVPHLRTVLHARPVSETKEGTKTIVKYKLAQDLTKYSIRLNATHGETISWYVDFLAQHGDESLPVDTALAIASATASPPPEAILETSAYDSAGGRTIFRARWKQVHNGLPVEDDFIEVLVNARAKKAFACTRFWHVPAPGAPAVER
jgi:hypothetical protein